MGRKLTDSGLKTICIEAKSTPWRIFARALKTFIATAMGVVLVNVSMGTDVINWKNLAIIAIASGVTAIIKTEEIRKE